MMRKALILLLVVAAAGSAAAAVVCMRAGAGDPDGVDAEVFPWPAGDAGGGSVSGFAFDGEALWITRDGAPLIHRVDPQSGAVTRTLRFVTGDTGGNAWDGRTLWQIAYLERMVYAVDVRSGTATPAFKTPGNGLCAGMTFDGRHLWIANFEDARIYRVDPAAGGKVIGSIDGNFETTGLAWDGESLWMGILVGTKTHDEATPYTGFVQQLDLHPLDRVSRAPRRVWAVPGVGPGASDWVPGSAQATRFWWYDGFHKRVLVMQRRDVPTRQAAAIAALAAAAACAALVVMLAAPRRDVQRVPVPLRAAGVVS
jgi:hypothetical protein